MYGDAGFLKKKQRKEQFVYDSGLKLGYWLFWIVPTVYSTGLGVGQARYNEKLDL
jgi:predicted branched-subunit amino acid permease